MEGRTKVYDCKDYYVMRDDIDGGFLAYGNDGIFITATPSDQEPIPLEDFKKAVECILEKGYNAECASWIG